MLYVLPSLVRQHQEKVNLLDQITFLSVQFLLFSPTVVATDISFLSYLTPHLHFSSPFSISSPFASLFPFIITLILVHRNRLSEAQQLAQFVGASVLMSASIIIALANMCIRCVLCCLYIWSMWFY